MKVVLAFSFFIACISIWAQPDTVIIGFGEVVGVTASGSSGSPIQTINQDGFLPNLNAASRFLSQSALGHDYTDIEQVSNMGIEDWIDDQFSKPIPYSILNKMKEYHQYAKLGTNNPTVFADRKFWLFAYWQYHMQSTDLLRQRIALALSEIFVVSERSSFGGNPYALSTYYDLMLNNAFTNYRTILQEITYNPAMANYLTFMNNPKSNTATNLFPDENYAREIMQLFSIGTVKLNMDGTPVLDSQGQPMATYNNTDIAELSKVFTGLTWGDRTTFGGQLNDTSFTLPIKMINTSHEPGIKNLLNGFTVPNRSPVYGNADISDALNNLFNHPNVPPFFSSFLIQRLVTSNPSPSYVSRVANVFVNNGQGVRGDMKSIIKAILLDPEAKSCGNMENKKYGALREPFIRYMHIMRALNTSSISGNYRNDMDNINKLTGQRPLNSPSVFNFFQSNYQPIGPLEDNELVGPEFQITNAQTIAGYINGLYRFVNQQNIADESDLYNNENDSLYINEISTLDLSSEYLLGENDKLHMLIDRLNLLFANGRLSNTTAEVIRQALLKYPTTNNIDREARVRLAIYLVLSSPEYLIKK
jgi:uncharacterized protein (DUF1800 family)